jgi:hypothetical protein
MRPDNRANDSSRYTLVQAPQLDVSAPYNRTQSSRRRGVADGGQVADGSTEQSSLFRIIVREEWIVHN